jgi:hypothetical protein
MYVIVIVFPIVIKLTLKPFVGFKVVYVVPFIIIVAVIVAEPSIAVLPAVKLIADSVNVTSDTVTMFVLSETTDIVGVSGYVDA